METIKKNMNKIIIAIVVVFVATFAFNYINKEETTDVVEVVVDGADDKIARQIIEALNELDKINIDYSFFNNSFSESENLVSFNELEDFSAKQLQEKPIGKNNPFLRNSASFAFSVDNIGENSTEESLQTTELEENNTVSTTETLTQEPIFEGENTQ